MANTLAHDRWPKALRLCFAMVAPALWFCSWFAATATPGLEPFPTWTRYFAAWASLTLVILIVPAPVIIPIAIVASKKQYRAAASAITALNLCWLFMIVHIAWCVAYLLAASYVPNFNGTTYSGKLPTSWQSFLNAASNPLYELLLALAATLTIGVVAFNRMNASEKFLENNCHHCGYNLQGINAPLCPECGHHTNM